ncbi:hypothetical protein LY78DRAFT_716646 [Colletotrichum sublineola]|uniref:Uncharacterized protein n=1 Tax=Colletotrichum sublineola TaxID=1173701 RepID=A0A066X8P5_COLSU|nr:hypothetical protein LY78DRAFT_716646 [Colletotrichum sublineola]KDN65307.1 hypothetical protein CSUB01_06643 [Colletotrichum sublineola]
MEECSSVKYLDSLITLCNTDQYQSICLDNRKGHVSCNVTLGGPFSIAGDLQHFFLPYGTVAWISCVIGLWIWISLLNGTAPLNPGRAIKHKAIVSLGVKVCMYFLVLTAIARVHQLENRNLKIIAIGYVVALVIIQLAVLSLMEKNTFGQEEPEKQVDNDGETKSEDPKKTTDKDNITPRPSAGLARSTSTASTSVSVLEKPGFLEQTTNKIPSAQRTETSPASGEASTEADKEEKSTAEWLCNLFRVMIWLTPGHIMMFWGVIGIAKQIFATGPNQDARQQREVRDAFILFGVVTGIGVIIGIIGVVTKVSGIATQSPHEESAAREPAEKKRAAEAKTVRKAVVFGAVVLCGILSLWCQYFVLAAAARDTHGIVHLGQTCNASLVYLILSKLLIFAC